MFFKSTLRRSMEHVEKIKTHAQSQTKVWNATTLARAFDNYAHPGLFSLNWRHRANQRVADTIAKHLSKSENLLWTQKQCLEYIRNQVNYFKNENGTFSALIRIVTTDIEKSTNDTNALNTLIQ